MIDMIDVDAVEALKFEGDPLADEVIADLVAGGQVDSVNEVLAHFRANDQPIPENLPDSVRAYLIATDDPPAWADLDRVAGAYDFFVDDGVHVASVLSFGAMVNCYAQPRPSRVLALTHRLNQPHRRLSETSQFVLNMMGREPFGAGGTFVPTVQKTRLIHAAVRHFITRSGGWDVAADGVPVCQQDMLGALLIFSVQVIDGMRRIGISVTEQEAAELLLRLAGHRRDARHSRPSHARNTRRGAGAQRHPRRGHLRALGRRASPSPATCSTCTRRWCPARFSTASSRPWSARRSIPGSPTGWTCRTRAAGPGRSAPAPG